MAGRGFVDEVEPVDNPNLKVLRNGKWCSMFVPVNCDRVSSGICLAESFADAYHKEHNVDVGLIPCADGGSQLDSWKKGSLLYDNCVFQTKLAERTSTLAGILWHQGESDCSKELHCSYTERFEQFYEDLKKDLNLTNVPFLVGGLGDFLTNLDEFDLYYEKINTQLQGIAQKHEKIGFVSAVGLTANPDNLHFNSKSLRELGLRYYEEFKKLEDKSRRFEEKDFDCVRTAIELL